MSSTHRRRVVPLWILAGACLCFAAARANAAESYDNCTGFVDSVPATIATQGVWCLRGDLSTAMASGVAITIAANNVTLDCNDFKLGGLAAGNNSLATGVGASSRNNATVRNCAIRGFRTAISLQGPVGGHLVEDNRIDNSLEVGIFVQGGNSRVQRNRVHDTGGRPGAGFVLGIAAEGDVVDNTVAGLAADAAEGSPVGIYLFGRGSVARGNQVRDLATTGEGQAIGILADDFNQSIIDNRISSGSGQLPFAGIGIANPLGGTLFCTGNSIAGFALPLDPCLGSPQNLHDQ